jgi:hypothetical protein
MTTYAIFIDDCEVWVTLKVGDRESIDTARELIGYAMKDDPSQESGYVESYPFFQADWQVMGYALPANLDKSTILEVTE